MYNFAILALLGLATWKFVGMLLGFTKMEFSSSVRTFITLGVGIVAAELINYSMFAAWGFTPRNTWMGPVFSGLAIGAMAYVWHHVLGVVEAYGRRNRDEAREIEGRTRHAA